MKRFYLLLLITMFPLQSVVAKAANDTLQIFKKEIRTNNAPLPIGPYSQAIVAKGRYVFLSGQIAIRPDGKMVEGGIEEQTRQVFDNLRAVLQASGCDFQNVVKTTVLMKDLNEFSKMNAVYATYFKSEPPARATFQVVRLPKDALIEIEAIAVLPE